MLIPRLNRLAVAWWAAVVLCLLTSCGGGPKVIRGERHGSVSQQTVTQADTITEVRHDIVVETYPAGDRVTTRRQLEAEASVAPTNWQVHYRLGQLSVNDGEYERAMNCYQAALTFASNDKLQRSQIYLALAFCWERLNKPALAKLNYLTASQLNPDCQGARKGLARLNSEPVSRR
jgi:tetratricopeptide (TPR) repeat protein